MSIAANAVVVKIADWIAGRHGPEAGDVTLDRRRVYILPTAPGVAFGVVTLILLIGSINYMLQLGYLLTFLVASMAVVGMHNTHSNLAQVVLRGVQVEPVYAGDVAAFEINVTNPTTVDRFALRFSFAAAFGARAHFSVAFSAKRRASANCRPSRLSYRRAVCARSQCLCRHRFAAACRRRASRSRRVIRSGSGARGHI